MKSYSRLLITSIKAVAIFSALFTGDTKAATPTVVEAKISGRYMAVISDGDFFASSYADGRIPSSNDSRYQDALTLITLPFSGEESITSIEVSNSVNGPPEALALSPDGKVAFIIEYVGQRKPDSTTRNDLPPGQMLTMIDLTEPTQPRILDQQKVGPFPEAIDVHPKGNLVALATDSSETELLQLVPVSGSRLGNPISFSLEALGVPEASGGPLTASYVEWHPSGQYLAVNLHRQNRVVFLKLKQDTASNRLGLALWGNPVAVGEDPYSGRFTPDGQYYITTNWGRDFEADTLEERLPTEPGTLSVIRLGVEKTAEHQLVSTAISDRSPEGIAISPDGTLVATANMRDTALPISSSRFTREATVSFFAFDSTTGQLTKAGDFPFEGVLPEGISFDAKSEHVAVATFEYLDSPQPTGGVEAWQILRKPNLQLKHLGRISVPHGAHQVLLAP